MRARQFVIESITPTITGWRGVGIDEAKIIIKQGHMLPSRDLMPFDYEVVEYGIGDEIHDMSEEDIESWVQYMCPWYDGSRRSVEGGMNLTSDFDNAGGYGRDGVIFGVYCKCDVAEFSDAHLFAQNANDCIPIEAHYKGQEMTISELSKVLI